MMKDFCPRMTQIDIISQIKVLKQINISQTVLALGFLEKTRLFQRSSFDRLRMTDHLKDSYLSGDKICYKMN